MRGSGVFEGERVTGCRLEVGGETVMTTLCCFAEVCCLAVNHSLAGMVAYANDQGSPQVGVSMLGVSTTPPVHPNNCHLCVGW